MKITVATSSSDIYTTCQDEQIIQENESPSMKETPDTPTLGGRQTPTEFSEIENSQVEDETNNKDSGEIPKSNKDTLQETRLARSTRSLRPKPILRDFSTIKSARLHPAAPSQVVLIDYDEIPEVDVFLCEEDVSATTLIEEIEEFMNLSRV